MGGHGRRRRHATNPIRLNDLWRKPDWAAACRGITRFLCEASVVFDGLKFALRQLRRSPGFALAAILTLGLGIGANTAIFSLVHAILLKELPFPDVVRVVTLKEGLCGVGICPGES